MAINRFCLTSPRHVGPVGSIHFLRRGPSPRIADVTSYQQTLASPVAGVPDPLDPVPRIRMTPWGMTSLLNSIHHMHMLPGGSGLLWLSKFSCFLRFLRWSGWCPCKVTWSTAFMWKHQIVLGFEVWVDLCIGFVREGFELLIWSWRYKPAPMEVSFTLNMLSYMYFYDMTVYLIREKRNVKLFWHSY